MTCDLAFLPLSFILYLTTNSRLFRLQGNSLSLTSTVCILPISEMDYNLSNTILAEFWYLKKLSLAIGGRTLFIDLYGQISLPQIEEDVYKMCH